MLPRLIELMLTERHFAFPWALLFLGSKASVCHGKKKTRKLLGSKIAVLLLSYHDNCEEGHRMAWFKSVSQSTNQPKLHELL